MADTATIIEYWGTKSGGFPAILALSVPVVSEGEFAEVTDGAPVGVKADAARFEKVSLEVVNQTALKLVEAIAAQR